MEVLRSLKELVGYKIGATDRDIGRLADVYFDDATMVVRHLVVDTGGWLSVRRVLIPPVSVGEPDWSAQRLPVSLSSKQVEQSPPGSADLPVSRQQEAALAEYYQWAPYWVGVGMAAPVVIPVPTSAKTHEEEEEASGDPHLRSLNEVMGYRIRAASREIGGVDDLIVDTDDWAIRYLVVDIGSWLAGRRVLVPPGWISRISWYEREIHTDLDGAVIEGSPSYDPAAPVNREYEVRLYDYYGRPRYWQG
jgi:sporulation protein YlmC with PRC-barrel domain